jgi:dephospho-CoA kinase
LIRVGLTGGLASGKSSVALVFAEAGAHVFSADALGRALMQPGEAVYRQIVDHFGAQVVAPDGQLDRSALAREAFEHGRLSELNAIVHPAVFRAQAEQLDRVATEDPNGIAVIESALIFEVSRGPEVSREATEAAANWTSRFDKIVLVTAPDELKIARYLARTAPPDADQATRDRLIADARARLAAQIPDAEKIPLADYVIENTATLVLLRRRAQAVFAALRSGNPAPSATSADNPG